AHSSSEPLPTGAVIVSDPRHEVDGTMTQEPKLSAEDLVRLLSPEFPRLFNPDTGISILKVWHRGCLIRQGFHPRSLRPRGTISRAAMMMLADFAMYVAVLGSIGWVPHAVTTNLNMNFLTKPPPRPLEAECRLIKLGKRLAVGDVAIRSEGETELV